MAREAEDAMVADENRDDLLILVDGLDRQVGVATKEQAHREGLLHRAFSVVLVAQPEPAAVEAAVAEPEPAAELEPGIVSPRILLSRRTEGKYHSAGLWANSCCSHPRAGEALMAAAARRVTEELGCEAPELEEIGAFVYRAPFSNGLVEHEYDHVLLGRFALSREAFAGVNRVGEGAAEEAFAQAIPLNPDPTEVAEVRWVTPEELAGELAAHPERFTAWAPMVLSLALQVV